MHEQPNDSKLPCPRTLSAAVGRSSFKSLCRLRLLALAVSLLAAPLGAQDETYTFEDELSPRPDFFQRSKRLAAEQQELYRLRVPIPEAVKPLLPTRESPAAIRARAAWLAARAHDRRQNLFIASLLLLIGVLLVRRLMPDFVRYLNLAFNPWVPVPVTMENFSEHVRAEDAAFDGFIAALHNGPALTAGESPFQVAVHDPLDDFHARRESLFAPLRTLLREFTSGDSRATSGILSDLCRELRTVKGETCVPELLPAWQIASALEGLLKQLTDRAANVSPSTRRTVGAAVELLENLCRPGVRPDLLAHPPLRLLVVDDDLISRKAVSLALKKAFHQPDLAEDGEKALALATMQAYDAVFLDVQMPGMDGFEVCQNIHKTVPNAHTPVVFVTCMSDFEARAQSVLSGGCDLIGKPFLTFEITVKALTLILQARLRSTADAVSASPGPNGVRAPRSRPLLDDPAANALWGTPSQSIPPENASVNDKSGDAAASTTPRSEVAGLSPDASTEDPMYRAFLDRTVTQLGPLRDHVQAIFQVPGENTRQEMLGDLYLRLNALIPERDSIKTHPAVRMSAAIEALIKKLLEDPKHGTSSTLFTLATAVDVLHELCAPGVRPDLASNPPFHMLVADDDPVSRRAMTLALQTAFEKPEAVDCGEAAVAAARANTYDVIFLDVNMPRMDGFTASAKIREIGRNRTTPVVFVTGQNDFKSRTQANLSGGNDLIGKPFLTAEITVKALTFGLRGRLRKLRTGARWLTPEDLKDDPAAGAASDRAAERRDARRRAKRFKRARHSWYQSA